MAVRVVELPAPASVLETEDKAAERVERLKSEGLKNLSDLQNSKLTKHLKKIVKAARKESATLRKRLVRYNDMLEGIVEETNFPFEGASNTTLRYAAGLARTFESSFNKTVYSDEELFYPVLDPGAAEELKLDAGKLTVLQEGFNYSFSTQYNGLRTLKGGTIPAFRDGTFLVEGSWERRVERVNDQRTYKKIEEFEKDYPSGEGISEGQYNQCLDFFLVNPDDAELIVRFSHDHVMFDGIEYSPVLRAKFLAYPTSAKRLADADMYGCMYDIQRDDLKRRGKAKEFYKDGVSAAIARKGSDFDEWDKNRLYVEGYSSPDQQDAPVRCVDVVVKFDLDNDGTRELWRVQAATNNEEVFLLSVKPYDLRHNVPGIVPLRLIGRDAAFDGISLIGDGEDMFNQVDTLFRHDNNVMMLTTSPIFLANENLKETMDLGRAENIVRPGVTYWVPDIEKAAKQLIVADVSAASGKTTDKMAILGRFAEMLLGVTQGESGSQTPDDPRAPAHKTQLLLMQANKRIDHCIDEWSLSFPELAKLHATLLYQYSPERVYKFQGQQNQVLSFELAVLADPRLRWAPRRRSVTLTPEFALGRLQSLAQTYMGLKPLLMTGDPIVTEIWNRTVRSIGEPQAEKFMITPEMSAQMAQQAMAMAMKQAEIKSLTHAKAKGQEKLATEAAKTAVKHLSARATDAMAGATGAEASAAPPGQNGNGGI